MVSLREMTNVTIHPHRPKVFILRLVQPVEAHPISRRIHLAVESRRFDGLLLIAGEAGEAVGEGIGNEEVHEGGWMALRV